MALDYNMILEGLSYSSDELKLSILLNKYLIITYFIYQYFRNIISGIDRIFISNNFSL